MTNGTLTEVKSILRLGFFLETLIKMKAIQSFQVEFSHFKIQKSLFSERYLK